MEEGYLKVFNIIWLDIVLSTSFFGAFRATFRIKITLDYRPKIRNNAWYFFIGGNNHFSRGSVNVYPLGDQWTYIPRNTYQEQGIMWSPRGDHRRFHNNFDIFGLWPQPLPEPSGPRAGGLGRGHGPALGPEGSLIRRRIRKKKEKMEKLGLEPRSPKSISLPA